MDRSMGSASFTSNAVAAPASNSRFVKNAWYAGLWASELPAGALIPQTILNQPIVFFRQEDGSPAAILDRCSHRFAQLSMGKLVAGGRVQCPYHGLEFAANGQCVNNPHPPCTIPAAAHLPSFPVVEKHTLIWIWMGDKPADPDLIPDYSCLDSADPKHVTDPGYLNIKAQYELIIHNLLDLSHVVYVHDGILGSPGIVESDVKVDMEGDVVTVSRYAKDVEQPGMFKMLAPEGYDRADSFTSIAWYPPSNLFLETGTCKTGQPKSTGTGYLAIHLLTPETERTTHYRFSAVRWHVMTEGDELNEQIRQKIFELRRFAFADQDGPVIEAQQRLMDQANAELTPVMLGIDAGPVRCKRVLDSMLAQEG